MRKYMPPHLNGKTVVTNTTTDDDIALLKERGVNTVITTTPIRWLLRLSSWPRLDVSLLAVAPIVRSHSKITMAHQSKPGTTKFAFDISLDAKMRFESLHQSMELRTKTQTFEAILYFVSTKDKIDPAALQRMEKKIDPSIHLLESLT